MVLSRPENTQVDLSIHTQPLFVDYNKREIFFLGAGVTISPASDIFQRFNKIYWYCTTIYQHNSHAVERLELKDATRHHSTRGGRFYHWELAISLALFSADDAV